MTMVPGLVTDTVVAPGTARRSKPSTRSPVVWMPTAPHTKAAVSPSAATMAATQYPAVDGRVLAWSGGMDGRVGGGRSSFSEEGMSFVSFSSPFTLLQIWPTVRSQTALIREAPWSPVHPVHCLGRPPRRSEDDGMGAALLGGLLVAARAGGRGEFGTATAPRVHGRLPDTPTQPRIDPARA